KSCSQPPPSAPVSQAPLMVFASSLKVPTNRYRNARGVKSGAVWGSVRFQGANSGKDQTMPTFVTIGYGDRDGYDRTSPDVRTEAHAQDARLRTAGADMGVAGG